MRNLNLLRGYINLCVVCIVMYNCFGSSLRSRAELWGSEIISEAENTITDNQMDKENYKQNLLQYVLRTDAPTSDMLAELEADDRDSTPFVMNKIYDLLVDKSTGVQKRSSSSSPSAFEVDFIRGLQDEWGAERGMQFKFDVTMINDTEDVIEAYFHIYKKRAFLRSSNVAPTTNSIFVKLYKILDENTLYDNNNRMGSGAELLEQHRVSTFASEWIYFKQNLTELVRDWIRHPMSNKGLLLTATDLHGNHVNGTHIEFVQRGENPKSKQPVFVVYTDQERKKNNKVKRKHKENIDKFVEEFLNERVTGLVKTCRTNNDSQTECAMEATRQRRSLSDDLPIRADAEDEAEGDGYNDMWEDESSRSRRRLHNSQPDLNLEANRRSTNNFCKKKDLYISFSALGWGKWIVAPEGLNANFCDGICPFPLTSTLTSSNHAVLQSVSNHYYPNQVKAPCCVPQKLARMSILYHQTEKTVTMRNYDDMIVETCGCR